MVIFVVPMFISLAFLGSCLLQELAEWVDHRWPLW